MKLPSADRAAYLAEMFRSLTDEELISLRHADGGSMVRAWNACYTACSGLQKKGFTGLECVLNVIRDGARYQWLKKHLGNYMATSASFYCPRGTLIRLSEPDKIIDTAMKETP